MAHTPLQILTFSATESKKYLSGGVFSVLGNAQKSILPMAAIFSVCLCRQRGHFARKRPAIAGTEFPSKFDRIPRPRFRRVCDPYNETHTFAICRFLTTLGDFLVDFRTS